MARRSATWALFEATIRAAKSDPRFAAAYFSRGEGHYEQGDYDRAIAEYDQAIQLDPKFAIAYNSRGNAYAGKGQYQRAIQDYDEAIRLNPRYAVAYINRGVIYYGGSTTTTARSSYDQAIKRLRPECGHLLQTRPRLSTTRATTTRRSWTTTRPSDSIPIPSPTAIGPRLLRQA